MVWFTVGSLFGSIIGVFVMGDCSVDEYEKGFEDGKNSK